MLLFLHVFTFLKVPCCRPQLSKLEAAAVFLLVSSSCRGGVFPWLL